MHHPLLHGTSVSWGMAALKYFNEFCIAHGSTDLTPPENALIIIKLEQYHFTAE